MCWRGSYSGGFVTRAANSAHCHMVRKSQKRINVSAYVLRAKLPWIIIVTYLDGPGYLSRYSDSLRAGRLRDRLPAGARFSARVQTDPEAHTTSYTMGTGSYPGLKWPGRGVDHPPASSAEVNERVELYLYSLSGPSWRVLGWPLPLLYLKL